MDPTVEKLIGTWFSDPDDELTMGTLGLVKLVFEPNQMLTVTHHARERGRFARLWYRVEGATLHCDPPFPPLAMATPFSLASDERLILEQPAGKLRFVRVG